MVRNKITYTSSLAIGEELKISVRTLRIGRSSLTTEFQFTEASLGSPVATITETAVNMDLQTGRSARLPEDWKQKIIAFEGKENIEVASG